MATAAGDPAATNADAAPEGTNNNAASGRELMAAEVRYIFPDAPGPTSWTSVSGEEISAGSSSANHVRIRELVSAAKPMRILDARTALPGGLRAWELDVHGFCCLEQSADGLPPGPANGVWDMRWIEEDYGPAMAAVAKRLTGADRAFLWQFIKRGTDEASLDDYYRFAHSDYGPGHPPGMRRALHAMYGVPEEEANDSEVLMLNVWHPRFNPAFKDPLALLDWSSLEVYAPVTVDMMTGLAMWTNMDSEHNRKWGMMQAEAAANSAASGGNKFETTAEDGSTTYSGICAPLYSPTHRWVFCPDMKPTEVWLFKQFDSRWGPAKPKVAQCSFHSAVQDPFHQNDPSKPPRQSLEMRVLLSFRNTKAGTSSAGAASSSKL